MNSLSLTTINSDMTEILNDHKSSLATRTLCKIQEVAKRIWISFQEKFEAASIASKRVDEIKEQTQLKFAQYKMY